jgi:hypothetical protein
VGGAKGDIVVGLKTDADAPSSEACAGVLPVFNALCTFVTVFSAAQCWDDSGGGGGALLRLSGAEGFAESDIADCSHDRGGTCYRRQVEGADAGIPWCDGPRHVARDGIGVVSRHM